MELVFALFSVGVIAWALAPRFQRWAWARQRRLVDDRREPGADGLGEAGFGWPPPEDVDWPPNPGVGRRP